jgi:hypothetical protein
MDQPAGGCSRRAVMGTLAIIIAMLACLGGTMLAADRICAANLKLRLPVYPGAETVWERHNFLSRFGMGETVITLHSDEAPDTVREWYARHTGEVLRAKVNDRLFQLARGEWVVDPAQEGSGSQIILHGTCLQ